MNRQRKDPADEYTQEVLDRIAEGDLRAAIWSVCDAIAELERRLERLEDALERVERRLDVLDQVSSATPSTKISPICS